MTTVLVGARAPWASAVRMLALGLALSFFDVRIGGFDVLPDVVGWALVAVAAGRLALAVPGLRPARRAALVTAVLSLADAARPSGTTVTRSSADGTTVVTGTSTVVVVPEGVQGALVACYHGAEVVALVLLCLAVVGAAAASALPVLARRFRSLAWSVGVTHGLAAAAALVSTAVGADAVPRELVPVLLLVAVAGFAVGLWLLVAVWSLRASPLLVAVDGRSHPVGLTG